MKGVRDPADTSAPTTRMPPSPLRRLHAKTTMSNILKQLAGAQFKMAAITAEMKAADFEGSAGGGLVKVTVSGAHEPKAVSIHPDVLKEDVDTVQELVTAALKAAHQTVETTLKQKTATLAKALNPLGLRMPGL